MSNTTFTNFVPPAIDAGWLNDVNNLVYNLAGNGVSAPTNDSDIRTNIGLGTIAIQNANNVAITGGSVTGITDLAVADGGTGASTAAAARTNLNVAQIGPTFLATRITSDQTLTASAFTEIIFNSEDLDTDNAYNITNGRFTPQVAGVYQLNTTVTVSGTNLSNIQIAFYKNGVIYRRGSLLVPSAATFGSVSLPMSGLIQLNGSTDFVSIYIFASVSAGSPTASFGGPGTWFDGTFVRP